jgi:GNAT superfamily N-acetyltransferase
VQEIEQLTAVSERDFADIARILRTYSPAEVRLPDVRAAVAQHCVLVVRLDAPPAPIIGFVTLVVYRRMKGLVAQVEDIIVDDAYRKRGVGLKLLAACVSRATEVGCADVHLTTYPTLVPANRLYQSAGWTRVDAATYKKVLQA